MQILAIITGNRESEAVNSELHLVTATSLEELWNSLWNSLNINFYIKKGRKTREELQQLFINGDVRAAMEQIGNVNLNYEIIRFEYIEENCTNACCADF